MAAVGFEAAEQIERDAEGDEFGSSGHDIVIPHPEMLYRIDEALYGVDRRPGEYAARLGGAAQSRDVVQRDVQVMGEYA